MAQDLINPGESIALTKRQISADTCHKFDYTVGSYRGAPVQIAPYRNQSGAVVAQHVRFPDKDFRWIGTPKDLQLWGQHLWRAGGKRVVITEGEIDAMSVSQLQHNKWPVVSITSGANAAKRDFKNNLEWLDTFDEVVICFDMDAPGQDAAKDCAMLLPPGKAKIVHMPFKDANECVLEGKSRELISALWDAKEYRPDGIINGKDLRDLIMEPPPVGYTTPYPILNEMVRGMRKGELYIFTAGSGIGKSTMVNEIGHYLFKEHNLTLGILAMEENPRRTAERYVGIELNYPLHLDHGEFTEEEILEAFDRTFGSGKFWLYKHFGSSQIDGLLSKIRYMAVALECDFIILDHISIVVSGLDTVNEDERRTIDKLMTKLRAMVEETNVGIIGVVHLKRPSQGKSYNEGRSVSLSDLRGSGSLEHLSDVVVSLERNQQGDNPNESLVRVLKNRPVGTCGMADTLVYDPETNRLVSDTQITFGGNGEDF